MEIFCETLIWIGLGIRLVAGIVKAAESEDSSTAVGGVLGTLIGIGTSFLIFWGAGTFN
jgi:hypothetical protein